MSISRASLSCSQCGYRASQWRGRCPQCGAWDSFVKEAPAVRAAGPGGGGLPMAAAPVALAGI
ncbi:MAG TPA: DNA repair protein RadA, partial [Actinomycetota bacterium]